MVGVRSTSLWRSASPLGLIQDENPLCVSLENVLADILPGLKAGSAGYAGHRAHA